MKTTEAFIQLAIEQGYVLQALHSETKRLHSAVNDDKPDIRIYPAKYRMGKSHFSDNGIVFFRFPDVPESVQWYGERFLQLTAIDVSDDQQQPPKLLKELPFFDTLKNLLS